MKQRKIVPLLCFLFFSFLSSALLLVRFFCFVSFSWSFLSMRHSNNRKRGHSGHTQPDGLKPTWQSAIISMAVKARRAPESERAPAPTAHRDRAHCTNSAPSARERAVSVPVVVRCCLISNQATSHDYTVLKQTKPNTYKACHR